MGIVNLETARVLVRALGEGSSDGPELDDEGDCLLVGTDEKVFHLHYDADKQEILVLAVLGELPEDDDLSLQIVRNFLSANLLWAGSHGRTFALDDEANAIIVQDAFNDGTGEDLVSFMNGFATDFDYFAEIFSRLPGEIDEYENS